MSTTESTMTKNERPNYRRRQVIAGVAAAAIALVAGKGIYSAGMNFIDDQHAEHAKTAFFSQEGLAGDLKATGDIPKNVGFYDVQEGDTSPTDVARTLGAKDIPEVADLISNQVGGAGNLQPADELALPLDAFDQDAIKLHKSKDVLTNPNHPDQPATITYIQPANPQQ